MVIIGNTGERVTYTSVLLHQDELKVRSVILNVILGSTWLGKHTLASVDDL